MLLFIKVQKDLAIQIRSVKFQELFGLALALKQSSSQIKLNIAGRYKYLCCYSRGSSKRYSKFRQCILPNHIVYFMGRWTGQFS